MKFSFLFSLFLLNAIHGQPDDICLSLRRGPDLANQPKTEFRGAPGKAGAPGLSGPKGAPGVPGLAGTCTCETEEINKSIVRRACIEGMIWNNACVYLPYTSGRAVSYDEAVRVCNISEGELLKITDDKMYDVVYDYLNRTWVGYEYTMLYRHFWLGMTYQPVNNPDNLITITPEWKITLNRWDPDGPRNGSSFSTYVNIVMRVRLRGENTYTYEGIYNISPNNPRRTPLCQYQL